MLLVFAGAEERVRVVLADSVTAAGVVVVVAACRRARLRWLGGGVVVWVLPGVVVVSWLRRRGRAMLWIIAIVIAGVANKRERESRRSFLVVWQLVTFREGTDGERGGWGCLLTNLIQRVDPDGPNPLFPQVDRSKDLVGYPK